MSFQENEEGTTNLKKYVMILLIKRWNPGSLKLVL